MLDQLNTKPTDRLFKKNRFIQFTLIYTLQHCENRTMAARLITYSEIWMR